MNESDQLLHIAARDGDSEGVRQHIVNGANPNAIDPGDPNLGAFYVNLTPLMAAAGSPGSNAETVAVLLEKGADINAKSAGGVSAVWYAAGGTGAGYMGPSTGEDHQQGSRSGGAINRIRTLLDAGGDPNEAADNGRTAVGEAAASGDHECLGLLIERGGRVWPVKPTLSKQQVMPEAFEYFKELIGTELDFEGDDFESFAIPLFEAAESGSLDCLRLILDQGFPINFQCDGKNVLHFAKTLEVVKFLWQMGVRPVGEVWSDAISEAFESDAVVVAEYLLSNIEVESERQKHLDDKLFRFSGDSINPKAVEVLLRLGADVNALDLDHSTPLHRACWQGDGNNGRPNDAVRATLELLIGAGARVNSRGRGGGTPLHEAVSGDWGSPTSTSVLLSHGAEVNAVNNEGSTPLMLAAFEGTLECVRLLISAGADPNCKDKRRKSAKDYAREHLKAWRNIVKNPRPIEGLPQEDPVRLQTRYQQVLAEAEAIVRLMGA